MTKKYSTKKALMASVLSLLLCFSMLVGTTFAWFTDSVTSAGNIIKTGNLDIEMYWADGTKAVPADENGWTDASTGAIFDYDNWEPGYVQVRHIKIANEGTLALKYKVNIVANGEVSDLADVIDVYYVDPAVQVANRTNLTADMKLGTLTEVLANLGESGNGTLEAGKADTITIAFKMQESASNDYMNKSIGTDFSIQLLATQLASDQYDKDATYTISVNSTNELVSSFENMTKATVFDATGVSLDVDAVGTTTDEIVPTFSIPTGATVKGAEFKIESNSMISAEATAVSDTVVFDECDIVTADANAADNEPAMAIVGEMGTSVSSTKYVFNNCTFKGYIWLNGINVEFNNCTFVLSDENDGATYCSFGKYVFNNCTFNYKNGTNLIASNTIYADSYATVVLNDCTLVSATYGNSADSTITVE